MGNCVIYQTKNCFAASQTVAIVQIAPKICPVETPTMYSRVLQILSKLVHIRWSYRRTPEHHQIAPYSKSNIRPAEA